ncbi:MAG: hypothetical protein EXQ85_07805 [Alphaproteobacteria bacterium]|nr:hypothetical protein [Alphaproteobacteria bacterium]
MGPGRRPSRHWLGLAAGALALLGAGPTEAAEAAHPVLAIEINEPPGFSHREAIALAKEAGATGVTLSLPWAVLEPRAGQFDSEDIKPLLAFYREEGMVVLLSLGLTDSVRRQVPADLVRVPWNDGKMTARLRAALGHLLELAGEEVRYVVLGDDLDTFLASRRAGEWEQIRALAQDAQRTVLRLRPDTRFGVALSATGLDERTARLTAQHGAVVLSHYFVPRRDGADIGAAVERVLGDALQFAGPRPVLVKEWGFPTGGAVGGSDRAQATFVAATLAFWRRSPARLPFLAFSQMFDDSLDECSRLAEASGLSGNQAFIALQCTTGLRTIDNEPKPAWAELRRDASAP